MAYDCGFLASDCTSVCSTHEQHHSNTILNCDFKRILRIVLREHTGTEPRKPRSSHAPTADSFPRMTRAMEGCTTDPPDFPWDPFQPDNRHSFGNTTTIKQFLLFRKESLRIITCKNYYFLVKSRSRNRRSTLKHFYLDNSLAVDRPYIFFPP